MPHSVCCLWKWWGGTLVWYKSVYWVHWLWGLLGDAGQSQPLSVSCLRPPGMSYKVICGWLPPFAGLRGTQKSQATNQGWMPLVTMVELEVA